MDLGTAETLAMFALASVMTDHRLVHGTNTPEYADMSTTMCDLRSAVNLARGVPPEHITALGYPDLGYLREQRARRPGGHG